ncbi:MAG TPA: fused MFS/spermidine synthase [Tepidisphaeraceae bacterium]|nr:fused MFS/spermidine synthase [Tepidisphaeraceae bacterium]
MEQQPANDRLLVTYERGHGTALVILAFGSGCAALVYEVVWFQLLEFVIGSSAVSLSVLLSVFMGGTCLGSMFAMSFAERARSILRLYAAIELTVAICGISILTVLPHINGPLLGFDGSHLAVRGALAAACLFPPTICMGAELPAVTHCFRDSRERLAWVSYCYAGSLAGGLAGGLLAGFYLLRVFDVNVATWTAIAINWAVALSALLLSYKSPVGESKQTAQANKLPKAERFADATIYAAVAFSGAVALSAEIVWTRALSLAFAATVYVFSMVAAAFLLGLAIGSTSAGILIRKSKISPRTALGWCQIFSCVGMAFAAHLLTDFIPNSSIAGNSAGPWHVLWHESLATLAIVLPCTVAWGMSFPLGLASLDKDEKNLGQKVAYLYAVNTAGAILGAIGTTCLFAQLVGTQRTVQLAIVISAVAGMSVLLSATADDAKSKRPPGRARYAECACIAVGILLLLWDVAPLPGVLIAYGRRSAEWIATSRVADTGHIVYAGEGLDDFVAVSETGDGAMNFHASGKVQASTSPQDMRLQLLLGHLSHFIPEHPSSALVIGCGAGITAGALSIGPGVHRVRIVEIEPLIPQIASRYFAAYNNHVMENPAVSLTMDDGRHFLATTNERFDVISTDLVDPWVKGVATLFTSEFFELERRHLNPGGVVTLYIQLYQSSPDVVKSEIATFLGVFPNSVIWGNPRDGQGYDLVILGQVEPVKIDVDRLEARLNSAPYSAVMKSLRSVGIGSTTDLMATYAASGHDLTGWLQGAVINRDRNLRLQYLAGLSLDDEEAGPIYSQILSRRRLPSEVFAGPAASLKSLERSIRARGGN